MQVAFISVSVKSGLFSNINVVQGGYLFQLFCLRDNTFVLFICDSYLVTIAWFYEILI